MDFETFFEATPDLLCVLDAGGRLVRANRAMRERFALADPAPAFAALFAPADAGVLDAALRRLAETGRADFHARLADTAGASNTRWRLTRDPGGHSLAAGRESSVEGVVGAGPHSFRAFVERAGDLTILLGADGTYLYLNPVFESAMGYPVHEWIGRNVFELIWPDDRDEAKRLLGYGLEHPGTVVSWQLRLRHADGDVRWFEGTGVSEVGNPAIGGIVINCRDITERKRTEAALESSYRLLARLAQQVPGVIYQYRLRPDGSSCFPFASEAIRDIYEVSPDDVREDATVVFGRLHPEDYDAVASSIAESARTLEPWRCEYRVVLPRQGVRWRSGLARPQREADGSILWHGFITDATPRKRAEAELLRMEGAIASSLNGIAMSDRDGRLTYVNRALLDLWGFREEADVLGRPVMSFWDAPEAAARVGDEIRREGRWAGELVARRADGSTFTAQVSASQYRDAEGRPAGMLASFLDVTEAKRLQAQLLQSQKMDSLGQLAGGVAHDFNNLLTVIKGRLELAQAALAHGDPRREDLEAASRSADSAARLTQQLLAFSRKQVVDPRVLDLREVVLRIEGMLRRILGEDIELRTEIEPGLGAVRMDRGQLEQVILNLAVNARDAMPQGGRLAIEVRNAELTEAGARELGGVAPGEYVTLTVRDSGVGMSEEVRSRLFEPFYTTKPPGSGTGLGLALVYGVVSQSGGRITVESEPGAGSLFRIHLPRVREEARPEPLPEVAQLPTGREIVLLVEDDDDVRALAGRLLERLGYRVHAFGSGSAAILTARGMPEPPDLLLTDVVMPEMNGRQLAEEIRRLCPGIRVVYSSGYADNVLQQHGVAQERVEFLPKPYSAEELARSVRAALERPER